MSTKLREDKNAGDVLDHPTPILLNEYEKSSHKVCQGYTIAYANCIPELFNSSFGYLHSCTVTQQQSSGSILSIFMTLSI